MEAPPSILQQASTATPPTASTQEQAPQRVFAGHAGLRTPTPPPEAAAAPQQCSVFLGPAYGGAPQAYPVQNPSRTPCEYVSSLYDPELIQQFLFSTLGAVRHQTGGLSRGQHSRSHSFLCCYIPVRHSYLCCYHGDGFLQL